ncbi:nucleotide exchange factors-like protein [Ganoderma leucocontextum]|nr:nucleotide exchange factors-like protein [Ganoderma leucocontextum]
MEGLLRWGITNSTPQDGTQPRPQPRTDLDPGIIDAILGKSDAELMKEALTVAVDEKRDEDDRVQALDDFEMLVEQIDNANNLEKLKMWEPLQGLLVNPSSSEEIQRQTLWVLGTAVQNNPAAQNSYLALSPLPVLLSFLSPAVRSGKTRSKAVYALSSLLRHNAPAVTQMTDAGGWIVLRDALQDSDITVRRKVAFLFSSLLIPTSAPSTAAEQPANIQQPLQVPTTAGAVQAAAAAAHQPASLSLGPPQPHSQSVTLHPSEHPASGSTALALAPAEPTTETSQPPPAPQPVHPNSHASMVRDPSSYATSPLTVSAFEAHGVIPALVASVAVPVPYGPDGESEGGDVDFEENVLHALHTYVGPCGRQLPGEERRTLGTWLDEQSRKAGGDAQAAERWAFTPDEVRELKAAAA